MDSDPEERSSEELRQEIPLSRSWGTAGFVALSAFFVVAGLVAGRLVAAPSTQMLAFAGSVMLVYFAVFVWQPAAAILAYIALRPLVDAFVFQQIAGLSLGELWGLGMILSACLYLVLENADQEERLRLSAVPIGFLFIVLMLYVTRSPLVPAVTSWTKIASWILVMLVCERVSRDSRGQRMTWWAGIAMGAMLTLAVAVMIRQDRYGQAFYDSWGPARSWAANSRTRSPWRPSCSSRSRWPERSSSPRGSSRCRVAAGLLAAVFLSYVRTALLGALVVLAMLLLLTFRYGGKVRAAGFAVAIGTAVGIVLAWDRIAQRFSDLTLLSASGAAQGEAGSGRVRIWSAYADYAFDSVVHALVGRGANAAELLGVDVFGRQAGAHNDVMELLLAGGLLLVAAFVVLLVWMATGPVRLLRDPRQSPSAKGYAALALGAVVAFALMSQLNGIVFYQSSVVVGLVVGLCRGMAETPGETFLDEVPADERLRGHAPPRPTGT